MVGRNFDQQDGGEQFGEQFGAEEHRPQIEIHVIDLGLFSSTPEELESLFKKILPGYDQGHQYVQNRHGDVKRERQKIDSELDKALEVLAAKAIIDARTSQGPKDAMWNVRGRLRCAVALGMLLGREEALKDAQAVRN